MWSPFLIYTPDDARGHQIRPVRRETGSGDRKIPASEKTWGTRRGDILVPLFSPRLLSLGPGGAGVGRIGGGTFSPPVRVGVGKPPLLFTQDFAGPGPVGELLRKTWGTLGGGTFLSPSSPRLLSLGSGGAGVARIGGGTFSPRGSGGRKTPTPFLAGFRRTGAGGGASEKNMGHSRRGDFLVPLFAAVAFAGLRWGRSCANRRGDFQSPRESGGRKTPTPFRAGFRRTGAGGGAPEKNMGHSRRGDFLVPLFAAVAFAGLRWGRSCANRRGDFQSPRESGGRKTPTPFRAGFHRTGAGGGAPIRRGDFPVPPSPDPPPRFRARNARNRDGSARFTAGFPATCPGGGPSGLPSRPPDPVNSPGIRKQG